MKKIVFLAIIFLTLQGFSQVKSGVYKVSYIYDYTWVEGEQDGNGFVEDSSSLIQITENGFRSYKKDTDTGEVFSLMYMGVMDDGFHSYAIPTTIRLEIKDDLAVMFYDFDTETGWFGKSKEFRGLEYLSEMPILKDEK